MFIFDAQYFFINHQSPKLHLTDLLLFNIGKQRIHRETCFDQLSKWS